MKMTLLMSAMLFTGVAMATPQMTLENPHAKTILQQQEKVKIEADALPDAVKTTISSDETVNEFTIAEAFKIAQLDGTFHYEVVFDNGTEEKLTKKYDQEGKEIIEL